MIIILVIYACSLAISLIYLCPRVDFKKASLIIIEINDRESCMWEIEMCDDYLKKTIEEGEKTPFIPRPKALKKFKSMNISKVNLTY